MPTTCHAESPRPTAAAADPQLDVLLVRAGRAVERWRRAAVAAHGLSTTGLAVLAALADTDRTSHRDLAAAVDLAPATLTPVLDALEAAGLVHRERAVEDRRTVGITLTRGGRERLGVATADLATQARAWLPASGRAPERELRRYLADVLDRLLDGPHDAVGAPTTPDRRGVR